MSSKAKAGAGVKLKIGDGASPEVFTALAEIKTLTIGGMTLTTDDVTNLDSTASNGVVFKEFIGTVGDGGEIDFTYNFTTDATGGVADLRTAFDAQQHNFQIVFPELNSASPAVNKMFSFTGIVSLLDKVEITVEKARAGSGKIKVTGPYSNNW